MITIIAPLVATFIVSIVPIGVLVFLPHVLLQANASRRTLAAKGLIEDSKLNVLLCFAAGSLVADALLHLLPQSMFGEFPSPESARRQGRAAVLGICTFFLMDVLTRAACEHEDGAAVDGRRDEMQLPAGQKPVLLAPMSMPEGGDAGMRKRKSPSPHLGMLRTGQDAADIGDGHVKGNSGILSLLADALHNFTDGLALSASFAKDFRMGVVTTAAIFFHEIPHELGDYAILAKSGYRHDSIIRLQLLTASAAFLGTLTGIALRTGWIPMLKAVDEGTVLPFAAGGFIYVALCSILPEVLSSNPRASRTLSSMVIQITAFGAGIAMMAFIE